MLFGALTVSLILVCAYVAGKMAFDLFAVRKTGAQAAQDGSVVSTETIQKMRTIEEMVDAYYYGDEVTAGELQDGVYKGMVKALGDPYSEYFSKEELEDVVNNNQGISYGIGAMISINTNLNTAMISGVLEESPAMEAGLKEGDIIYKVGDEFTQGMSLSKVVSLVKGREGTIVNLTIYREGEPDYLEMEIVRAKQIETTTVDSGMIEGHDEIGYLRIREFEGVTPDQFTEAMAVLKENGMRGLVLDLRSNPGGDLTAVVDVARQILPAGLIVYTEDKAGNRKEYTCDGTHELQMPLVVLTNEYSASASEILAGAIKDYNKGTLIGTTTFGKGIVQRINRLKDGTAIKLTVSAYFTPSGKNIHGIGIKPDIVLEYDDEAYEADGTDNQVMKAIEVLEGKIG
ncbi:MAG: S41 family peptidase [Lachnospiraceae bacterium]|nr:S41 family peptidase [Lachnospiraceae bacterium]